MFSHLGRALVVGLTGASFLIGMAACTQVPARKAKSKKADSGELFEDEYAWEDEEDPETQLTSSKVDGGVITVPERPSDGGADVPSVPDAGLCSGDIAPGDLRVVEMMIASKAGSNDLGEWVEIQSTLPCRLNIKGITVSSPRGTSGGVDSVTINQDYVLEAYGFAVIANVADPTKNGLQNVAATWGITDVLKNDGDTVQISYAGALIDTLTYPALSLVAGTSFAFPYDCPWNVRDDWTNSRWSLAVNTYDGTFKGTPNTDNTDVRCY